MASVRNPETLIAVGNNAFRAAADTFVLPPSEAGSSGAGKIVGGAVELSKCGLSRAIDPVDHLPTQLPGQRTVYHDQR